MTRAKFGKHGRRLMAPEGFHEKSFVHNTLGNAQQSHRYSWAVDARVIKHRGRLNTLFKMRQVVSNRTHEPRTETQDRGLVNVLGRVRYA
jgi:hypothetical protein